MRLTSKFIVSAELRVSAKVGRWLGRVRLVSRSSANCPRRVGRSSEAQESNRIFPILFALFKGVGISSRFVVAMVRK
jgi:hypothetical protein